MLVLITVFNFWLLNYITRGIDFHFVNAFLMIFSIHSKYSGITLRDFHILHASRYENFILKSSTFPVKFPMTVIISWKEFYKDQLISNRNYDATWFINPFDIIFIIDSWTIAKAICWMDFTILTYGLRVRKRAGSIKPQNLMNPLKPTPDILSENVTRVFRS